MTQAPPPPQRVAKPRGLMFVVVLMFVQALFNVGFGILTQVELNDAAAHGQTVLDEGLVRFAVLLSFVVAAAQLVCGVLMPRGIPWTRPTAIAVESATILSGVLGAINGGTPQLVAGCVLPALALRFLLTRDVAEWFTRR